MLLTTTTLLSQRAEPSPVWSGIFPKRRIERGTTSISRVAGDKAKRGCASRVPPSLGVTARRTRGVLVVRATPSFLALVRHERGVRWPGLWPPYPPSKAGVAPSTVIPTGRTSSRRRIRHWGQQSRGSGQEDHSSPTGNDRHLEDCSLYPHVRRVEPHGCQMVESFVPSRSVAIPLSTHPFTARKVHRNPIQNGGCNEGNGGAMEYVSYLYQ